MIHGGGWLVGSFVRSFVRSFVGWLVGELVSFFECQAFYAVLIAFKTLVVRH